MIKDRVSKLILFSLLTCSIYLGQSTGETPAQASKSQKAEQVRTRTAELIKNHQYGKAVTLCEDALKELRSDTAPDEKTTKQIEILLDEAQRQDQAFNNMVKSLLSGTGKKEIDLDSRTKVVIDKANETGFEGWPKGEPSNRYTGCWADIPAKSIYALFEVGRLKDEEKYNLAIWCFEHDLVPEAEQVLQLFYQEQPDKKNMIDELLARKRNIPAPEGGFVIYKERWVSAGDKEHLEKGLVKYEGQWVISEERAIIEKLTKLYPPKGVINLAGADSENLPWEKAREKESEHFIIKTNLSVDALNDICFLLEYAYFKWLGFLALPDPREKTLVWVPKNSTEFKKIYKDLFNDPLYPIEPARGILIPKDDPYNKLNKTVLLCYYYQEYGKSIFTTLLHEGTHYALRLAGHFSSHSTIYPPIWLDEGLATYFESSRIKGKKLVTNLINRFQLPIIKTLINDLSFIKLKEFINLSQADYMKNHILTYSAGWSLVYFLVNGKDGKYKKAFQSYIEAYRQHKIDVRFDGKDWRVQNKDAHIKLFEQCTGIAIDQLEKEWKEYILALE